MEEWIRQLIAKAVGPVRELAEDVRKRLSGIWSTVGRVFGQVRTNWTALRTRARGYINYSWNLGKETYTTLRWLLGTRIPALIASGRNAVIRWATDAINRAEGRVKALLSTLDRWAKQAYSGLTDRLAGLTRWVTDHLSRLWTLARATARRVSDLLTDPRKLAEWVMAPLVGAFWRYVHRQRDRIAGWFLRTSPAFTMWLARQLEDVLRRML